MGPGVLGSVLVRLPVLFATGTVIVFLPTCCLRFVTQFPGQRSSEVQPKHKDGMSRALSGEDCDTKHCSERQVQLQAGAVPLFPQAPSGHGVELRTWATLQFIKRFCNCHCWIAHE